MHKGVIINKKMNVAILTMYNINKAILCIVKYYSEFNVLSDSDFLNEFSKQKNNYIQRSGYENINYCQK